MQRIQPPRQRSVMVRRGIAVEADTLSELGVFGVWVRRGQEVVLDAEAGHLVRTKASTSDEGGVAAGFAVLDSPFLVGEGGMVDGPEGDADVLGACRSAGILASLL